MALKSLGRGGETTALYEAATLEQPENVDLASELFACYAGARCFDKQRALAMRLYKQHGQPLSHAKAAPRPFFRTKQGEASFF